MLLIKPSSVYLEVQVVTTTVFSANTPSTFSSSSQSSTSVPVPAIVGGIVVGAVVAVVVAVVWIFWGKRIKRDKQRQQEEIEKSRKTRSNTMQNARISGPGDHSYRPLLKRQRVERQVKFAGDEKPATALPPAENIDPEKAKHMLFDNPNIPPVHRPGSITWPLSLKKLSHSSIRSSNNNVEGTSNYHQPEHASSSRDAEKPVTHKTSNVSTHSNASQGKVPPNLIQAALGNIGNRNSLNAGDRQSSSSLWSQLFKAMPGARGSQHSNSENYQPGQLEEVFPVGTAL